jgi:hypothetical protein
MMFSVEGKVVSILANGFAIRQKHGGADTVVRTQIPGSKLSLKVGDRVQVLGGFSDKENVFASSGVTRICRDGSYASVRANWSDPPDEAVAEAKKPWWRFW